MLHTNQIPCAPTPTPPSAVPRPPLDLVQSVLESVGVRVDEVLSDADTRDWLERELVAWVSERNVREPVLISPLRAMTPRDKYAVLLAIHDVVCKWARPANYWDTGAKFVPQRDGPRFVAGLPYLSLMVRVQCVLDGREWLAEGELERVQRMLLDLEQHVETRHHSEKRPKLEPSAAPKTHSQDSRANRTNCGDADGPGLSPKETNGRHEFVPDDNGYVRQPLDPSAYIPAKEILTKHTGKLVIGNRRLNGILESYTENGVLWTRPPKKDGEPNPKRRSVHLASWLQALDQLQNQDQDPTPDEIAAMKAPLRPRNDEV